FRQARAGCEVRWRVGEIDARFNVSEYDVRVAAGSAAEAWNAAAGRSVLRFDETRGIPVTLVFDTNHTAIAANLALAHEIRRLAAEIEYLKPQFDRNQSEYLAERINRSIRQYNRLIDT